MTSVTSTASKAVSLTLDQVAHIDELVGTMPLVNRLILGRQMLNTNQISSTVAVIGPLRLIKQGLAPVAAAEDGASRLLATVRKTVDENIRRLEGKTVEGATVGYGKHPEYGDLGKIRADLDFLETLKVI